MYGNPVEMELHLVHRRADISSSERAVVAILLMKGNPNPVLRQFLANAKPMTGLHAMLDLGRGYFEYDGSLTTPNCDEGITWFVIAEPATVSPGQISAFQALVRTTTTNRKLQNPNGRSVYFHP
jgi:carbonic anhydrase